MLTTTSPCTQSIKSLEISHYIRVIAIHILTPPPSPSGYRTLLTYGQSLDNDLTTTHNFLTFGHKARNIIIYYLQPFFEISLT